MHIVVPDVEGVGWEDLKIFPCINEARAELDRLSPDKYRIEVFEKCKTGGFVPAYRTIRNDLLKKKAPSL